MHTLTHTHAHTHTRTHIYMYNVYMCEGGGVSINVVDNSPTKVHITQH